MFSSIFDLELALYYDIPTYSVKNSDTTDHYGHVITVGGVSGDFSHTPRSWGQPLGCLADSLIDVLSAVSCSPNSWQLNE